MSWVELTTFSLTRDWYFTQEIPIKYTWFKLETTLSSQAIKALGLIAQYHEGDFINYRRIYSNNGSLLLQLNPPEFWGYHKLAFRLNRRHIIGTDGWVIKLLFEDEILSVKQITELKQWQAANDPSPINSADLAPDPPKPEGMIILPTDDEVSITNTSATEIFETQTNNQTTVRYQWGASNIIIPPNIPQLYNITITNNCDAELWLYDYYRNEDNRIVAKLQKGDTYVYYAQIITPPVYMDAQQYDPVEYADPKWKNFKIMIAEEDRKINLTGLWYKWQGISWMTVFNKIQQRDRSVFTGNFVVAPNPITKITQS